MKKRILIGCFAVLAVAIAVAINLNYNNNNEISSNNVEALAQDMPISWLDDSLGGTFPLCMKKAGSGDDTTAKQCTGLDCIQQKTKQGKLDVNYCWQDPH